MPESWKRNRRPTDEYNDESFPGREDGSEGDDDSRRVFAPRESILSSVKRIIVHAKDSIMGFGRVHIVPVLPTLFIGVCMYGVAVNSPHLFSFLSGVAEKTHRKSLRWIKSVRRASSSPAQIKPLKIKICDPGDDNSHINNSKKMKVPESDMNSKASKKVTPTPTARLCAYRNGQEEWTWKPSQPHSMSVFGKLYGFVWKCSREEISSS